MVWATITGAGASTATKFYGDVMNKINNMFAGTDITDSVQIHTNVTWTFKGNSFRINDSDDSHAYIFTGSNLAANRTITLPLLTGNDVLTTADFAQLLKNKQLEDSTTGIVDNADNTKVLKLDCVGVTTGTTRTWTVPDASGTVSLLDVAQTMTGIKTLDQGFIHKVVSAPSDPSVGYVKVYPRALDANNDGWFIKEEVAGAVVEVRLS